MQVEPVREELLACSPRISIHYALALGKETSQWELVEARQPQVLGSTKGLEPLVFSVVSRDMSYVLAPLPQVWAPD